MTQLPGLVRALRQGRGLGPPWLLARSRVVLNATAELNGTPKGEDWDGRAIHDENESSGYGRCSKWHTFRHQRKTYRPSIACTSRVSAESMVYYRRQKACRSEQGGVLSSTHLHRSLYVGEGGMEVTQNMCKPTVKERRE